MVRLGDMGLEKQLLNRICLATDLLAPREAMTLGMRNVKPFYCGTFVFDHFDGGGRYICLEIEFQETEDHYETMLKRWYKFEGQNKAASQIMDLSHVDVQK